MDAKATGDGVVRADAARSGAASVVEERAAPGAFLAGTGAEVPRAPDDPSGRFAGVRSTGRMTRDEVLRLVACPPVRADPFLAPG